MSTDVNDHFYQGRTVLTEAQEEELERMFSYYEAHGANPWFVDDAVKFLRDLLPAYKNDEVFG